MIPWAGACVTILLGGRITDALRRRTGNLRVARNLFAVLAMAATSACFLVIPALHSPVAVITMMALGNALNSLPNAVFWSVIIDTAPARAGTFGGFTHFIANIAAVAAPTLAGFLAAGLGYNSIFVAAGVATAIGMAAMAFIRPGHLGRKWTERTGEPALLNA
jgi:MFS family permease